LTATTSMATGSVTIGSIATATALATVTLTSTSEDITWSDDGLVTGAASGGTVANSVAYTLTATAGSGTTITTGETVMLATKGATIT